MKAGMKSFHISEQIVFWEWISATMLGIAIENSVYHWSIEGESDHVKMFDRFPN